MTTPLTTNQDVTEFQKVVSELGLFKNNVDNNKIMGVFQFMAKIKPDVVKMTLDSYSPYEIWSIVDQNAIMLLLKLAAELNVDFMKRVNGNSLLESVIDSSRKQHGYGPVCGKFIIETCIKQNRAKFIEIVNSTQERLFNEEVIINALWAKFNKSTTHNISDLINFIESGTTVNVGPTQFYLGNNSGSIMPGIGGLGAVSMSQPMFGTGITLTYNVPF